jgi:hypothetical protein
MELKWLRQALGSILAEESRAKDKKVYCIKEQKIIKV